MHARQGLFAAAMAGLAMMAAPAHADSFSSYTCDISFSTCITGVASNGTSFDLMSATGGVGGSGLKYIVSPADTLTAAQITNLSAEYDMITGIFTLGSPRFTLEDDNGKTAYLYFGTPLGGGSFSNPNPNGTFASTGNYADLLSPDLRVYSNGFGGDNNPNTGATWASFLAQVGGTFVTKIYLDLDGGVANAPQEMLVNSFTVNSAVDAVAAVPEPLTLSLFGAGLAGAVMLRRKARKA